MAYVILLRFIQYLYNICLYFSGYTDLQDRKDTRQDHWRKPGWDECVAYTVPLIQEMHSRWMLPTSFSPIK